MIVSFIPGARFTVMQPNLKSNFKIKAIPADEPLCCKYVQVKGSQLKIVGFNTLGGFPIKSKITYLVDKALLQFH